MAQKAKKIVPKRIGNVKIPKRLRKTVNKALSNPKTGEVVSGALMAIGTALAKKTLGERAAGYGFSSASDSQGKPSTDGKPAGEGVADLGTLVAGATGEAVRGVTGAVTRIVEEAVDTLRRDFGGARKEADAATQGSSSSRPFADQDTEAGAQSEPASPADDAVAAGALLDGTESFDAHDDNDDPVDGNDKDKPGPMTGVGP